MEIKGMKNIYTCEVCGKHIVTVNLADGVTPAFLRCHQTLGCQGFMRSHFYRASQLLVADYEWYRPDLNEIQKLRPTMRQREYLKRDGLLLRSVKRPHDKHRHPARNPDPNKAAE